MLYKIILLCHDSLGAYTCHYDASGEWTASDMTVNVRTIVDARRGITTETTVYDAALVWQVDGPLTASSVVKCFVRPFDKQTGPFRNLLNARSCGSFSRYVGLMTAKTRKRQHKGMSFCGGCVSPCDMAQVREPGTLSVNPSGPLFSLGFPWYKAMLQSVDGLGAVQVHQDGTANLHDGVTVDHALYATYNLKQHTKAQRLGNDATALGDVIRFRAWVARLAASYYETVWARFNHRWGDNHTPYDNDFSAVVSNAIYAARVWYEVARALGYHGYEVPANQAPFGLLTNGVLGETYFGSAGGVTLETNAALVLDIAQQLYQCHQALLKLQSEIDAVAATGGINARQHRDTILQPYPLLWWEWVETGDGFMRQRFHNTWPPHDGAQVIQTPCQAEQAANDAYELQGGAAYALAVYERWNLLSAAIMRTHELCHLLQAFYTPQGEHKAYWERNTENQAHQVARLKTFPGRKPVAQDYSISGTPCDFREFKALRREPFLRDWFPCVDKVVTFKAPLKDRETPPCRERIEVIEVPQITGLTEKVAIHRGCNRTTGDGYLNAINRNTAPNTTVPPSDTGTPPGA